MIPSLTAPAAAELEADLRQLGGLARAGLARDHDDLVVADGGGDVVAALRDRQLRREGDVHGADHRARPRPSCAEAGFYSRSQLRRTSAWHTVDGRSAVGHVAAAATDRGRRAASVPVSTSRHAATRRPDVVRKHATAAVETEPDAVGAGKAGHLDDLAGHRAEPVRASSPEQGDRTTPHLGVLEAGAGPVHRLLAAVVDDGARAARSTSTGRGRPRAGGRGPAPPKTTPSGSDG